MGFKKKIALQTKTFPELVIIINSNKNYLNDEKNSYTISSLGFYNHYKILVYPKLFPMNNRISLIEGNPPQLIPQCYQALKEIFLEFVTNSDNTMSYSDMKNYIITCGASESSASLSRIEQIFKQHGNLNDRLDLNGFINFYRAACLDRIKIVWNDLIRFNYRYDLKKQSDIRIKEEFLLFKSNIKNLPRYIISSNLNYFLLLFNDCLQLNDYSIILATWNLLLRLPTNLDIKTN